MYTQHIQTVAPKRGYADNCSQEQRQSCVGFGFWEIIWTAQPGRLLAYRSALQKSRPINVIRWAWDEALDLSLVSTLIEILEV